jgi:hypothetical protein
MHLALDRYAQLARRLGLAADRHGLLSSDRRTAAQDRQERGELLARPPSDGEVHYVWSFLLWGSVMDPGVRRQLRQGWGLCERHAWTLLLVEAAFRPHFPHASTLIYQDLMSRAWQAFRLVGPWKAERIRHALKQQAPCIMCRIGYGPESRGAAVPPAVLERGRDSSSLRNSAEATRPWWEPMVCGVCSGSGSSVRCRRHLRQDLSRSGAGRQTDGAGDLVRRISAHLARFARSFRWELRGTDTDEDRAALISAAGWCSGWRPLLSIMEQERREPGSADT